ncbi:sugar O-acetyltransferase [Lacticaseibacillus casei]|uniref:Sugar O-acetyltransferase n=1 Tax=Lacticaseibacillus huelsenbergensis TaxID=3035291 RepID=A0ABY8DSZ4_9LACO|nr:MULTISPECIES: sugar O-acetyltransferase [Lacticaseibacillus]MDG3062539.1 sugar O-acetyltransferase [Lacticaseibacillus sp. BCRC 81376]QVI36632.1 sugar O-acetyltransferase [Lacticaseibacillus casei]QXG58425.1 sugar O-acetyltransferase [Lacticaseibacillus casei]WFB40108.1 sugar O-acetyltransferase [Lacticaseibacillus huelsenbergensis]WFB41841.1 sugar O-acetyltransferase [Lacticaseibacillus huelsenbergensis]
MTTEKQKFLAGQPYRIFDEELAADEERARALCREINRCTTDDAHKIGLIRQLFGSVGKNVYVQPDFHCDFGYNIHVGDNFICNYNNVMLDIAPITIGDDCMFGPLVQLYSASHPLDPERRRERIGEGSPITIGNNVWIGGGAVVLPGVSIGDNTVIGANATVTHSFGANLVVAGNPARVIKQIPQKDGSSSAS